MDEAPFRDFDSATKRMIQIEAPKEMTLQEIRKAYGEVLRAWNELFSLHPQKRPDQEEAMESVDYGDIEFLENFRRKGKEIVPKLKEAADQSGNPATWRRGESLEDLNSGMRERILKGLEFGI